VFGVWGKNHPVMWGLDIVNFTGWVVWPHAAPWISAAAGFWTKASNWRPTIGAAVGRGE